MTYADMIKSIIRQIDNVTLFQAKDLFRDLYRKTAGKIWWGNLQRTDHVIGLRKIIATCWIRNWDISDYLEQTMCWFVQRTGYGPNPKLLSGEKAAAHYESFLRRSGYIRDTEQGPELDETSRVQELEIIQLAQKRLQSAEAAQLLPSQLNAAAENYAAVCAQKEQRRILHKPIPFSGPKWLALTDKQKLERYLQKVHDQAKHSFLKHHRMRMLDGVPDQDEAPKGRQLQRI